MARGAFRLAPRSGRGRAEQGAGAAGAEQNVVDRGGARRLGCGAGAAAAWGGSCAPRRARCCSCGQWEGPAGMIRHVWRCQPAAAIAGRHGAGKGLLILVSPGWEMAPGSGWMLMRAPAGRSFAYLVQFLEQELLRRRMWNGSRIARVVGGRPLSHECGAAQGAAAMLGGMASLVLKTDDGHVVNALQAGPAPPLPDACYSAAVLAETTPLPGFRFVSADRMRVETLHVRTDDATGVCRGWIGPCAAA